MEKVKGKIKKIIYQKDEFIIAILETISGEKVKIIGEISEAGTGDITGLRFTIKGEKEKNKYGEHIKIEEVMLEEDPMFFFLSKMVKGLGKMRASILVNTFPDIEYILENEPEKILKIKGISKKLLDKILEEYEKYKPVKDLSKFLLPFNISSQKVVDIYEHFKDSSTDIVSEIQKNPYILTSVRGIGFPTVDKIAFELGIPMDSVERCEEAIKYILKEALSEGHTYLTKKELIERLEEFEITDTNLIETALLFNVGDLVSETIGEEIVSLEGIKKVELSILDKLLEMNDEKLFSRKETEIENFIESYQKKEKLTLSDKQKEAIRKIGEGKRLFCLSGYAGTGKTTTLKAVMTLLSQIFGEDKIIGCSFTGISADRLKKVTGFNSRTIHSLLEWKGDSFTYGVKEKLPYKAVIVDEATMVDIFLFNSLLKAIDKSTMLVLVGDPAQLPPISAGNVFSDILQIEEVNKVILDKIFRQDNDAVITLFANYVREGKVPKGYKRKYKDFFFYEEPLPKDYYKLPKPERAKILEESNYQILEKVKKSISHLLTKGMIKDVIKDIQVLTPMRVGILGTENLNKILQMQFNPEEKPFIENKGFIFKEGDKVMHVSKNMEMEAINTKGKEIFVKVHNGQLGIIEEVDLEKEEIFVRYNRYSLVKYKKSDLQDILELAYAITVHKSQGSEFSSVVMVSSISHWRMLSNQLIYTGMTRAKKKLEVIGHSFAFEKACILLNENRRNTFINLTTVKNNK